MAVTKNGQQVPLYDVMLSFKYPDTATPANGSVHARVATVCTKPAITCCAHATYCPTPATSACIACIACTACALHTTCTRRSEEEGGVDMGCRSPGCGANHTHTHIGILALMFCHFHHMIACCDSHRPNKLACANGASIDAEAFDNSFVCDCGTAARAPCR